jgi:hypothetical protein
MQHRGAMEEEGKFKSATWGGKKKHFILTINFSSSPARCVPQFLSLYLSWARREMEIGFAFAFDIDIECEIRFNEKKNKNSRTVFGTLVPRGKQCDPPTTETAENSQLRHVTLSGWQGNSISLMLAINWNRNWNVFLPSRVYRVWVERREHGTRGEERKKVEKALDMISQRQSIAHTKTGIGYANQ